LLPESLRGSRRHHQDSPIPKTGAASSFAALASAAIVAVSVLPFIVLRGAGRRAIWLTLAVAALALGVGSFSVGGYAQRACTARYGEKPIVIGTELNDARRDVHAGQPFSVE
jgi:hypothetical protein